MRYKHIIWDWNGTLLDDVRVCLAVLNAMLTRRNLAQLTIEQYRATFDFPVIDFYRELGFDFAHETYDDVADEYIAGYTARLNQCRLQSDALAVLQKLSAAGLSHSVLSAYQQDRLEEAVELFGLAGVFIKLIGLDDYAAHSKLENGRLWIRKLHYEADRVLFVGDTLHDNDVAAAMDVDCILLTCGHQDSAKLQTCGMELFDSLNAVQDFLFT